MFGPRPRGRLRPGQAQRGAGLGKDGLALADLPPHPEAWLPPTTQGAGPVACAWRPHSHLPPPTRPPLHGGRGSAVRGVRLSQRGSGCSGTAAGVRKGTLGSGVSVPQGLTHGSRMAPQPPPPQAHVGPGEVQTRPHAGLHTRVHGSRPSVCLHMTDGQSMAQPHSGRRVPTTLRSLCRAKEASPGRRHAASQ